jgi:hypothetical protein
VVDWEIIYGAEDEDRRIARLIMTGCHIVYRAPTMEAVGHTAYGGADSYLRRRQEDLVRMLGPGNMFKTARDITYPVR